MTVAPGVVCVGTANPEPVMTTAVPPAGGPAEGVMVATCGAGVLVYVKLLYVPYWVSGLVATTSTAPTACAGVLHLTSAAVYQVKGVQGNPSTVIATFGSKPLPFTHMSV